MKLFLISVNDCVENDLITSTILAFISNKYNIMLTNVPTREEIKLVVFNMMRMAPQTLMGWVVVSIKDTRT